MNRRKIMDIKERVNGRKRTDPESESNVCEDRVIDNYDDDLLNDVSLMIRRFFGHESQITHEIETQSHPMNENSISELNRLHMFYNYVNVEEYEKAIESLESLPPNSLPVHPTLIKALLAYQHSHSSHDVAELRELLRKNRDRITLWLYLRVFVTGSKSLIKTIIDILEHKPKRGVERCLLPYLHYYSGDMLKANLSFRDIDNDLAHMNFSRSPEYLGVLIALAKFFKYPPDKLSAIIVKHISNIDPSLVPVIFNMMGKTDYTTSVISKITKEEAISLVKQGSDSFETNFLALLVIDTTAAKQYFDDHQELLEPDLSTYLRALKDISDGAMVVDTYAMSNWIPKLTETRYLSMITRAYSVNRYDLVSSFVGIREPESYVGKWMGFISLSYVQKHHEGHDILMRIDFLRLEEECITQRIGHSLTQDNLLPGLNYDVLLSSFAVETPYHTIMPVNYKQLLRSISDESIHNSLDWVFANVYGKNNYEPDSYDYSVDFELQELMRKKAVVGKLRMLFLMQDERYKRLSYFLVSGVYESLTNRYNELTEAVKLEERNRIIANLSHSIKNMLKAVIGPLQTLREEIPEKAAIIDNAIKGANLIREIVNAINLSFKITLDELNWDVLKPGRDSMTLQDMIADSLKYSIGNMFDFRYFPVYAENYFPRSLGKADFEGITSEWNQAQSSIDMVKDFCDRHLFKLELDLDDSRDYHVGNEKSSAIKLMILFQEMIFNAVKYTSFIPLEERTVQISLTRHDDKLRLMVRNSYSEKVRAKTTGVGKLVIENFAKVLGCEPKITTKDNIYSIEMEFADIWRKHAQDSIH